MNIALWIIQVILALMYVSAGLLKTFAIPTARERLPWVKKHTDNFVRFVGVSELLGAIGLILPMLTGILIWLTPVAALGLVLIQILAVFTVHLPGKEYKSIPINVILAVLAAFVAYGRFAGLS